MSTERLLKIKEQIDEAKNKQAEIRGKRSNAEEQMLNQFGIKTIEEGNKELKKRGEELDQLESKFEKEMKDLESSYEWN